MTDRAVPGPRATLLADEQLRAATDLTVDFAVFDLDVNGIVTTWNAGAERLEGYHASDIVGRYFSLFYSDDDIAAGAPVAELASAAADGSSDQEGWRVRKDGSKFWAQVVLTTLFGDSHQLIGFVHVIKDLTERQAADRARRESDERFRRLVQGVRDYAIFALDVNGLVTTWNAGAERIKGYRASEIIGRPFSLFYTPSEIAAGLPSSLLASAAADGSVENLGLRVRKDGSTFWAHVVITALFDDDHRLYGFAKVTRDFTERRAVEEMAQGSLDQARAVEAEARLAAVVESSEDAIVSWSLDEILTSWNPGAERLFGFTAEEMVGRSSRGVRAEVTHVRVDGDLVRVAEPAEEQQIRHRVTKGGPGGQVESQRVRKDGSFVDLSNSISPIRDRSGTLIGVSVVSRDVTARNQRTRDLARQANELQLANHELRRGEGRLREAQRVAKVGSWYTDAETGSVVWSEEMRRILGVPEGVVASTELFESMVAPQDRDRVIATRAHEDNANNGADQVDSSEDSADRQPDGMVDIEMSVLTGDGQRLTLAVRRQPALGPEGGMLGSHGTIRDVTEERALVDRLAASEQRSHELLDLYHGVLDAATEQSIIATDLDGHITVFNAGAELMLGYRAEQMIGKTAIALLDADELRARAVDRGVAPGFEVLANLAIRAEETAQEWTYVTSKGARLTVTVSLNIIAGKDAVVVGYICVATDVTARNAAERALRHSEQMVLAEQVKLTEMAQRARVAAVNASQQKSKFLATMSHEIRTPMHAVIGMAGLLADTDLDGEQQEMVSTVRTSGEALIAIINNILDFAKIESGVLDLEQHPFDLRGCVADALDVVAVTPGAARLELVGDVNPCCPIRVVGDVTRLRQVLVNLLANAVKFTEDGEVVVAVRPAADHGDDDHDTVSLTFAVSDTGIGIPADRLLNLFEPFTQADTSTARLYGGTGLGLAISHRLVTAMGGDLQADSTLGVGTTFSFTVSFSAVAGTVTAVEMAPPGWLRGRRALLVDDNVTSRRVLNNQLEAWQMGVTDAENGGAAAEAAASAERFDVAILDMQMPGMDGAELALALRSLPSAEVLPFLLLSSRQDLPPREQRILFAAVVPKPVRADQLLRTLGEIMAPERAPSALSTEPIPAVAPRVLNVLLVDDNAVNRLVGRRMLDRLGHDVDVADNGQDAADAVSLHAYDVVLMDVQMPGMNGLEATHFIRRSLPLDRQPLIIGMTAGVAIEDRKACMDAGMDDYLPKPVRLDELIAALGNAPDGPDQNESLPVISR